MGNKLQLTIEKLVPGGQALARSDDGKVAFVWGALPDETVEVEVTKKKSKYIEAVATRVHEASPERVAASDEAYLATSPWQIFSYQFENSQKQILVREVFSQQGIMLPEFSLHASESRLGYRNKMEFSFWWVPETDSVELAFHKRGSSVKVPVSGSSLARQEINEAAEHIRNEVNRLKIEARQLKTVIIRCSKAGSTVASLTVKDESVDVSDISLGKLAGLEVWYSDKRSPASVRTKQLLHLGSIELQDTVLGNTFSYDVHSFFQVNIPMYEQALGTIKKHVHGQTVDMFSGVGSIGLSASPNPILVEVDNASFEYLQMNANNKGQPVHAASEDAVEYIDSAETLILDPPRAGLHKKVIHAISVARPHTIAYLSCDSATHARDVALLLDSGYQLTTFEAYNFFPCTPHTETLAVLSRAN